MKIAIYTLTHQRDKHIDGILAEKLRRYGHEVIVRNYIYGARESVFYEKPDVIIHPMPGGQYKYDFVKRCKAWGIEVVVRRGEAGMGREQFNALDDERREILIGHWDYSPYVDLELTWGQEFSDILAEKGNMPARKIKACGAFAFDPYFIPDNTIYPERKKTILFATGFSTADCRAEYCECGLPEESDYHGNLHKLHRGARDVWLDAVKQLAHWFKEDWAFELKVRPGEKVDEYIDTLPGCVKVHPEDAPSSAVLKTVDILVHSGSTLAVEAHLSNVPSFNFCNVNPDPLLSMLSPMLESYDELEWNLSRVIVGHSNINEGIYDELQKHLYGRIDGRACERAAGFIQEHISGKKIKTKIPNKWPKEAAYLTEGIHLTKREGDYRWVCPCCRGVFYGGKLGIFNCPYCCMKIERTEIRPGSETQTGRGRPRVSSQSVLK